MDKKQAQKEIQKLSRFIEEHNHRYYVLDEPSISDKEYDVLLRELTDLERDFPELRNASSPTQRVGAKVPSGVRTVMHRVKMLSLDNTYSAQELQEWAERVFKGLGTREVCFSVELKIDGVSASLIFEKGALVLGATRGDGETGEDVTHNIRVIRSVPLSLQGELKNIPHVIEVRGEVYMNRADLARLNEERRTNDEDIFVNPRNAASGALKLLDPALSAKRRLRFFVHSFARLEGGRAPGGQQEFLSLAKAWGLPVNPRSRKCRGIEDVLEVCREFEALRTALPYDVDGVVVKVDDFRQQSVLGETMKSPRWAVAFKFQAYQATTTVRDIVIQVGRTGVLTPVAELEPVACGGVTIARATLHNFDEVKRLGVHVGARVMIERAGDVIPKIIKVVADAKKKVALKILPVNCPSCREDFICEDEEFVALRCVNLACPKQLERRVLHFVSRNAMDVEGMGEAVVEALIARNKVATVADLYTLVKSDLLELPLFADKKADKLLQAISASRTRSLARLIHGLGIPNIGEKGALLLARHFESMDALMQAGQEELLSVEEVGDVSAQAIIQFFAQKETRDVLARLKACGVNMFEEKAKASGPLAGKVFVFTGELARRTRIEAGALVKKAGGEVAPAVTQKTDFVVAGSAAGSKLKKARALGIVVIDEKQFEEMLYV